MKLPPRSVTGQNKRVGGTQGQGCMQDFLREDSLFSLDLFFGMWYLILVLENLEHAQLIFGGKSTAKSTVLKLQKSDEPKNVCPLAHTPGTVEKVDSTCFIF